MTPRALATRLRRRARDLESRVLRAENASLTDARNTARELSSGTLSYEDLSRMGHPYSRWRPRPPQDPAILNRHSGDIYNRWQVRKMVKVGSVFRGTLFNDSEHIEIVEGLIEGRHMAIFRPISFRIVQRTRLSRIRRLRAAFRAALK